MPREHVEFIQCQVLDWESARTGPGLEDVSAKVLSRDASSGACSLLLRYPPGWRRGPHHLAAAHEFLVLEGAIEWNGVGYGLDDYAWLPAGYPASGAQSSGGAVVLAFFDRAPALLAGPGAGPWPGQSPAIVRIATHDMPWTSVDIDPDVQFLRLSHKVLRSVATTGERTLLLETGAQTHPCGWREAQLMHDCVEELFMLGGDLIGERGTMYEGAYFWRPARTWHGPFGSRRGSLSLIRMLDGHHANIWSDEERDFTLVPPHAPVLPPAFAARGAAPWQRPAW